MKISNYIVTHKEFICPNVKGGSYTPIQVGKQFSKVDLGMISDDTGDNIAEKNLNYCELTALYWIWKNDKDSEVLGLCHYRRYLINRLFSINRNRILTDKQIERILGAYDVIVPDRTIYAKGTTIREKWIRCGNFEEDLEKTRRIIERKYPAYLSAYDKVLGDNSAHFYNILIAKRDLFFRYCEWLFDICEELEKEMDFSNYNKTQARFYGLISENLLDVWCETNGLKRYYCRMLETEIDRKQSRKNAIKHYRNKLMAKA